MSFINWGNESPEQRAARRRREDEEMLFILEQRAANAATASAAVSAGGSIMTDTKIKIVAQTSDFEIYLESTSEINLTIDWGDGVVEERQLAIGGELLYHTYGSTSTWKISIKSENLDQITYASLGSNGITKITGLGLMVNCVYLYLDNNYLTSLDTTWPAELDQLDLSTNQLSEFSPKHNLPESLTDLDLSYNQLTQFDPPAALPISLAYLRLDSNQLTQFDLTFELPQNLLFLNLSYNQLTQFNLTQTGMSISELRLNGNSLSYINISESTNSMSQLAISNNNFTDYLTQIFIPAQVLTLDISYNALTQFPTSLPSVEILDLSSNQITNVNPSYSITMLSGYTALYLGRNQITNIDLTNSISSNIKEIDLTYNQLSSISPNKLPTILESLNLYGNRFTSINIDSGFNSNLRVLIFANNLITSFDPPYSIGSQLRTLDLNANQLTVFSPTIALPGTIRYLYVNNNQLTSINDSKIVSSQMTWLSVRFNKLSSSELDQLLVRLAAILAPSYGQIQLADQNPTAGLGATGLAAKATLTSKNYNVTNN